MNIKTVLENTSAMICGRVDQENSIEKIGGMIEYNKVVLSVCKHVVVVLNRDESISEDGMAEVFNMFRQTFGENKCYFLQPHPVAVGRQVGHITLDKTGYLFIKNNLKSDYTMKMCVDIGISEKFLDLNVEQSDLYFLPAVGILDLQKNLARAQRLFQLSTGYTDDIFMYQSWFFIATNKTPYLYESDEEINRLFITWNREIDTSQNGVVCAEHSLLKWSVANKLHRHSLFNQTQFNSYAQLVWNHRIYDSSLKNVILEPIGVGHLHALNQPMINWELSQ